MFAVLIVAALVTAPVAASSVHVHVYAGHDHPEHHHGPSTHEHHPAPSAQPSHHHEVALQDAGRERHWESCDPGHHTVAFKMGCAHVPSHQLNLASLPDQALIVPAQTVTSLQPLADVRVHGPPCRSHLPSRAPPLSSLA